MAVLIMASSWTWAAAPAPGITVFVSVPPQAFLVEKVSGGHVRASVLVGPGQNPHTYEPTPRQLAALEEARAFFYTGMPFEAPVLHKLSCLGGKIEAIDMRRGVRPRTLTPDEENADDGGAHGHAKGEPDPHVWLNPRNASIMAANACEALQRLDPAHAAEYAKNLQALQAELDALDKRLTAELGPFKGTAFYVYHPAFGYFAEAYGLKERPVEIGGKEPSARQLAELIDQAKKEGVRVIFVQPQFSAKSAETVADAIGGAVIPMDDLAFDYIANLQHVADAVRDAMKKK